MSAKPSFQTSSLRRLAKSLITIRANEAPATIGVDIGSSSVKVVALGRRKGSGQRPVLGIEQVPLPEKTEDVAALLRATVERMRLPTRTVSLSVSGPSVIMRVVEMPMLNPADLKRALPFEAQRYLPFPLQDVVLDGEILGSAEGKKSWVLVVACKKDVIEQRLELAKKAGLEVGIIDVDALALANAFLEAGPAQRRAPTSAVVNIGEQISSVVVFKATTPYLVRDIPWGGQRVVRDLSEALGRDAAAVRKALTDGAVAEDFQTALEAASESLIVELQLSFDYFENQLGHPPEEVFVSGGFSHNAAFMEALKHHLTQSVAVWEPAAGVSRSCAVAFGLALRSQ